MRYLVVVAETAEDDLKVILDYVALESPLRAERMAARLEQAVADLADSAMRYAEMPVNDPRNVRRRVVGSYAIYYRVEGSRVDVLHILHGARDAKKLLFPDET
jgi:toxin ParE1/3/4